MLIARWHIEAKFGHKQAVVESLKRWHQDIGAQVGMGPNKTRMLTGSVGEKESAVEVDVEMNDMAELDEAFRKLAGIEAHAQWSKDLEPHMISGSTYWRVYRPV